MECVRCACRTGVPYPVPGTNVHGIDWHYTALYFASTSTTTTTTLRSFPCVVVS